MKARKYTVRALDAWREPDGEGWFVNDAHVICDDLVICDDASDSDVLDALVRADILRASAVERRDVYVEWHDDGYAEVVHARTQEPLLDIIANV